MLEEVQIGRAQVRVMLRLQIVFHSPYKVQQLLKISIHLRVQVLHLQCQQVGIFWRLMVVQTIPIQQEQEVATLETPIVLELLPTQTEH